MKFFYAKNLKTRPPIQRIDPLVLRSKKRINGTRKSIKNLISTTPGLSELEIAQWLDLSKQNAHYHIRELEQEGVITVQREWKNARCYIVNQMKDGIDMTETISVEEVIP